MLLNYGVEDSWEPLGQQGDQTNQSKRKSTLNSYWKGWCWSWISSTLTTWCRTQWKRPRCWERLKAGEKGMTEDEVVGWHLQLSGHEFLQTLGDGEGQGSLACCSPWGCKELDMTEQMNKEWQLSVISIWIIKNTHIGITESGTTEWLNWTPAFTISIDILVMAILTQVR